MAKFPDVYSRHYETPKAFLYFDALVLLGNVLSGRVRANFGGLTTQPRLYGLKVAVSGWRRKSTSTKFAKRFIERAFGLAQSKIDPLAFTDVNAHADMSDGWVHILPGAGSAEGVADELIRHKRVTLIYDELRRFERKAAIEGAVLISMVGELFDSNEYANSTKGKPLHIKDAHLGFLSNTTEENFQSLTNAVEMQDIGLLNRFLIVVSDERRKVAIPTEPTEAELQPILDELAEYLAKLPPLNPDGSVKQELVLELTPWAKRLWEKWYMDLPETDETTRLDNLGMRLMALLAFSSGKGVVDESIVYAVFDILAYQRRVRETYRPNLGLTPEAKIEGTITGQLKRRGPLTVNELRRYTHAERVGVTRFRNALSNLQMSGQIRQATDTSAKTTGPKPIKYEAAS